MHIYVEHTLDNASPDRGNGGGLSILTNGRFLFRQATQSGRVTGQAETWRVTRDMMAGSDRQRDGLETRGQDTGLLTVVGLMASGLYDRTEAVIYQSPEPSSEWTIATSR